MRASVQQTDLGGGRREVKLILENLGALPTTSLQRAVDVGATPPVRAELTGATIVGGEALQALHHLDGWLRTGFDRSPVYPGLDGRGHRAVATWIVQGTGATIHWWAGRGGRGSLEV